MDKNNFNQSKIFDLFTLPLISKFKYLQFNGLADGTPLVPNFNQADLNGRLLIIKGIKIVPYYPAGGAINQDFYITDGVTTNQELITGNTNINRLFEDYGYGCKLQISISGTPLDMFPQFTPIVPPFVGGNCPLDLDIDNIYYKYPEKISSLNISVDASIFNIIDAAAAVVVPNVKVFVQCYLI